jgi:hypothetical protein
VWVSAGPIIAAVLAFLSAIVAALIAMRGTFRTADTHRESAFDQAVDRDRQTLREERDQLLSRLDGVIADRDSYRERYVELRLAVRARGLDPDNLGGGDGV